MYRIFLDRGWASGIESVREGGFVTLHAARMRLIRVLADDLQGLADEEYHLRIWQDGTADDFLFDARGRASDMLYSLTRCIERDMARTAQ